MSAALEFLTGGAADTLFLRRPEDPKGGSDPREVFAKIKAILDQKWIVACSTREQEAGEAGAATEHAAHYVSDAGIVFNHAYSIIDADAVTLADGSVVRLCRVRNTWGRTEFKGR